MLARSFQIFPPNIPPLSLDVVSALPSRFIYFRVPRIRPARYRRCSRVSCIQAYSIISRGFCHGTLFTVPDNRHSKSVSYPVRNAASFILPVPYVSDFSITTTRYFTDNLRVANGVHNEAEMAWRSDGPRICLHSLLLSPLLLSSSFRSPNTRLLLYSASPPFLSPLGRKNAIDRCWYAAIAT